MDKKTYIKEAVEEIGILLTDIQVEQFLNYYELLVEWNEKMNLTAITEFEEVVQKHFVDSLLLKKIWDIDGTNTVLDLGTGAGFPGVPLKIAYPHLNILLLDSLNKRILFLNEVITVLGLEQIEAIHGRAEDLARKVEYRGSFDLCVSRAVANLASLSEYCLPFVKLGGYFIPYKSGKLEEELLAANNAIFTLGGKNKGKEELVLPDSDIIRTFVKIEKQRETPKKYPRKAGLPTKEPIA